MIRLGQLGLEFGLKVQVPAFKNDGRFELVSICSKNTAKAQIAANDLNVKHYTNDPKELFSKVDAVAMAIPPKEQELWLPEAIKLGLHVFFEKPLGFLPSLNIKMDKKQALMVDFEFMEIDVWKKLKTFIDSGKLGEIIHVEVLWNVETYSVSKGLKSWKTNRQLSGGALNNFGSHVFYYLEELFGPISEINAKTQPVLGDGDEVVHLQMNLKTGQLISVCVSTNSFQGSGHRMEVTGTNGTASLWNPIGSTVGNFELEIHTKSGESLKEKSKWNKESGIDDRIKAVESVVKKFGDWIELKQIKRPNLLEAYRVEFLLEASRKSTENGMSVEI